MFCWMGNRESRERRAEWMHCECVCMCGAFFYQCAMCKKAHVPIAFECLNCIWLCALAFRFSMRLYQPLFWLVCICSCSGRFFVIALNLSIGSTIVFRFSFRNSVVCCEIFGCSSYSACCFVRFVEDFSIHFSKRNLFFQEEINFSSIQKFFFIRKKAIFKQI